jgi:hypothetical protein
MRMSTKRKKQLTIDGTGIVGWLGSVSVRYTLMTGEFKTSPFCLGALRRRQIQKENAETNNRRPKNPPTTPPPIALLRV